MPPPSAKALKTEVRQKLVAKTLTKEERQKLLRDAESLVRSAGRLR